MKVFSILFFLLISSKSQAAWFGPSTYEECMNDGKVGRTTSELNLLKNYCQKKFPKLPKLHKLKDANIKCVGDKSEVVNFKIKNNLVYFNNNHTNFFKYRTADNIVLEPTHSIESNNKKIIFDLFFTVNTLNGIAYLKPVNTHNQPLPPTYRYTCTEE